MAILNASSEGMLEDGLGGDDDRPLVNGNTPNQNKRATRNALGSGDDDSSEESYPPEITPPKKKQVGDMSVEDEEEGEEGTPADGDPGDDDPGPADEGFFMELARSAYDESTDFLSGFVQKNWSRDIDHFQSKHAANSRYISDDYRARSRLFRPKTRAMVRKAEADCARAFFSTQDVVNISAVDDSVPQERASADTVSSILNYRLTKRVPWFRILQGQFQTCGVMGVCCSKQYWAYEEKKIKSGRLKVVTDENGDTVFEKNGEPKFESEIVTKVLRDDLVIEPIPPENIRVHSGADWLDPIKSSPYVIYRFPMYVAQVNAKSKEKDPKTGQPVWKAVDAINYTGAMVDEVLGLREKRDGGADRFSRQPTTTSRAANDQDLVWVHENIIHHNGQDWQYYTLGTVQILSTPRPLGEVYFLDERPFVWGVGQVEAFRLIPESKVGLLFDLQVRANHLENLRLDNVFQALEPKVLVKAASNIDLRALTSSRVGGVVQVPGNPADVVQFIRPPDVTNSSYQEQNMLNLDMDDIGGTFSTSSVASNKQLNETVGGMNLLSGNANTLAEYELRVFAETWVEPVLRQCVKLVQKYETDLTVLALAGKQAQIFQRYGFDPLQDDLLNGELTTTVNVGIGAANPEQRLKRFMGALGAVLQVGEPLVKVYGPQVVQSAGFEAITKEVFGLAGYKDGKRFMDFQTPGEGGKPQQANPMDPNAAAQQQAQQGQMQAMGNEIGKLQQEVANKQLEAKTDIQLEQMRQQGDTERTVLKLQGEKEKFAQEMQFKQRQSLQEQLMRSVEMANSQQQAMGPMMGGSPGSAQPRVAA